MGAGLRISWSGVSSGRSSTQSCSQQQFEVNCTHLPTLAIVRCLVFGSSRCPHVMSLHCSLFNLAVKNNFTVSAHHIPGNNNVIADSLFLFFMEVFFTHTPHRPHPSQPLSLTLFPSWRNHLLLASVPCTIHPRLLLLRQTLFRQLFPNIPQPEHDGLPNPCLSEHPHALCYISNTYPQTPVYQTLSLRCPYATP